MEKICRTIGAHWYSRELTLRECTEMMLKFLIELQKHNPLLFSNWYEKAGSKKEALENKIILDYDNVKKLFTKKGKDDAYPKVSYTTGIWNGANNNRDMISLSVSLGSSEAQYFTNNCVLELPYELNGVKFYSNQNNQDSLIALFREYWSPEWIMVDNTKI